MVNLASLVLSLSSLTTLNLALAGIVPRQASSSRTNHNYGSSVSVGSTSTLTSTTKAVGSDVNANPYPTGTLGTAFETIAPSVTHSTNLTTTADIADIASTFASGGVAALMTGSTSTSTSTLTATSTSTATSTGTSTLHLTPAYNNTPSTSTGNDTDSKADNGHDGDKGEGEWPVKYYDFTITWGDVDANGENRPAILVNGQTPGPLVEVEEGQRVSVSRVVCWRFRGFDVSRLWTNRGCQVHCYCWLTTVLCVRVGTAR
jgi:hypothetical protein